MAKDEKRGRGRPPKPHRSVHFKLSVELADWLEEMSARRGKSKTAIVEEALRLLKKRSSGSTKKK